MIRVFLLLLICQPCFAQIKLTQLDKKSLPPGIRYTGKIIDAVTWKDNLGSNYVITTETGIMPAKEEGSRKAALYAHHYLTSGDSLKQTWRVYDYFDDCPVDVLAAFVNKSLAVTDLNKNGKAEVWLVYRIACQGGVDPSAMKIIMYEDDKKYAMRGESKVILSPTDIAGGQYTFDDAFKKAVPEFRKYAEALWKKHVVEFWVK